MKPLKQELSEFLLEVWRQTIPDVDQTDFDPCFDIPREERFGELSSHVILRAAKSLKRPPRPLADSLIKNLNEALERSTLKDRIARVTVEGPGFINFYYTPKELAAVLGRIRKEKDRYGKPSGKPKKILMEFVSANPTGPLTVAHGRQAALGDSLTRILKFCGHSVSTEYYNNDEGVQIDTLGKSTELRTKSILTGQEIALPENYYQGGYLVGTANELIHRDKLSLEAFEQMDPDKRLARCADFAKNDILSGIQKDLRDFGVFFDHYYSQGQLGHSGKVEKTLEELRGKGVVYESEGAVWFRSTDFGDDKDRVLVKSDKSYTYLTPDIAYHHEKFERGFEELINIWGPDHHGYIARLKASQTALGHDPSKIHILIAQLVTLFEGNRQVRMSTRAGEFVTLRQILDTVGADAGRFFFLMRKFDAHLDFDLELAKSQTPENPVFYIQYANARIESIKMQWKEKRGSLESLWGAVEDDAGQTLPLTGAYEQKLLKIMTQYEDHVLAAERTLEPYRIVAYLMELAGAFHRFYAEDRVLTEDAGLTEARMLLVLGVQTVLRLGLGLLGVSAPDKM